jgi:hypothetical protein
MAAQANAISGISDVSYLLTRLRLAVSENEMTVKKTIVQRLRDLGFLKGPQAGERVEFKTLRVLIDNLLGTDGHH